MMTIDTLLAPNEEVVKHDYVTKGMLQAGDLYVTTTRVLFLYRSWGQSGNYLEIPLSSITRVQRRWASLVITADQDYKFSINLWSVQSWVDAVQSAQHTAQTTQRQAPHQQGLTAPGPPRRTPPQSRSRTCPTCGHSPVYVPKYGRYYCNTCHQYLSA